MTDDTLTTKYRPNHWEEIFGQDAAISALTAALEKGSSRSFLLSGPSGTGKTTLARIVARELGCKGRDLLELDAATYTGVEDVRGLQAAIQYLPFEGERRAIILDEAHRLSANAWDACLKSIEEPAPHLAWFICTTQLHKVPVTIKRRCLHIELQRVTVDVLTELIVGIAQAEGLELPDGVADVCARNADGSPGRAVANLLKCQAVQSESEARKLCQEVADTEPVAKLCQLLMKGGGANYVPAVALLKDMKGTENESIRIAIVAYLTAVALNTKTPKQALALLTILDAFNTEYRPRDGLAPLLLSVGSALLQSG
jgi:DNA polymerase-3 subunit gamma/tau